MHSSTHFILAFPVAACLLLACGVLAQDEPLPASVTDPFTSVKDAGLHAALSKLASIRPDQPTASPEQKARHISEIYSEPENLQAIGVVLAAAEKTNLNDLSLPVQQYVIGTVKAAVISGSPAHVPALTKLARSADKNLRNAVASPDALALSPSPSIEVLKECILSAEAGLPASLSNPEASQPSVDEFVSRVNAFTTFANPTQRASIAPIVERFLARFDNAKFREFYGPRLQRMLSGEPAKLQTHKSGKERSLPQPAESTPLRTDKSHEAKPETPSEEVPSSTLWSVVALLTAAAMSLLWHLLKKRK